MQRATKWETLLRKTMLQPDTWHGHAAELEAGRQSSSALAEAAPSVGKRDGKVNRNTIVLLAGRCEHSLRCRRFVNLS